jgi:hypothetical protein
MKVFSRLLPALSILCAFTLVQGQSSVAGQKNRSEILQEQQLKKLLAKAGVDVVETSARSDQPQAHREVKIRWSDPTNASSSTPAKPSISVAQQKTAPSVSLVEDKKRSGTLPRHRALQLSPNHLFIAAVNETNQLRWWSIISDPRVVRGEFQTADGELRREDYSQPNFTLSVAFPDDPGITNLRFYKPIWNGTDFDLELLAVVSVR